MLGTLNHHAGPDSFSIYRKSRLKSDSWHRFKTSQDHVPGNSVLSVRVAFSLGYVAAAIS